MLGRVGASLLMCVNDFTYFSVSEQSHTLVSQVSQCKDSGRGRTQYLLSGLRVLPVGACARDRERGFQRDGSALSAV